MEENKRYQKYYNPCELPKVTLAIVIINVVLFVLQTHFFKYDAWSLLGINWDKLVDKEVYRLFTAMFTHASLAHLGSNMIALYGAGMYLEEKMGAKRFLIFYLLCGVLGEILGCTLGGYVLQKEYISVGASGAVFGLVGMLIILSLRKQMFRIPMIRIILFVALCITDALTESGVDIFSHAGGFVVGIVIGLIYSYVVGEKTIEE
jgi:rhomboid protease GluP